MNPVRAMTGYKPKPGGRASMKALERAFSKRFTIDDDAVSQEEKFQNLKLPSYVGNFEHIFAQIGFIGFWQDLEKLNKKPKLPPNVAAAKWKELIEAKHAEWTPDEICEAERKDKLAQALLLANEETYEAYRLTTTDDQDQNMDALEKNSKASLRTKRRERSRKKAKSKAKEQEDVVMGSTLTQNSGIKKNTKKVHARSVKRKVVIQKNPISSRLRSKVDVPELPPIETDPLFKILPLKQGDEDINMES